MAFYFAFLNHYTEWLYPISILGIYWFISQIVTDTIEVAGSSVFIGIFLLWATAMVEVWFRKEEQFRFEWGMQRFYQSEIPRPTFRGTLAVSTITGEIIEMQTSKCEYYCKIIFSTSAIFICISTVVAAVVGLWMIKRLLGDSTEVSILIGVLNSIQIVIMNYIYDSLAIVLNEFEGHRLEQEYYNHLVIKRILFFVVNSFNSLIYIAFYRNYDKDKNRLIALRIQLVTLFITSIVVQNLMEVGLPKLWTILCSKYVAKRTRELHQKEDEARNQPKLPMRIKSDWSDKSEDELRHPIANVTDNYNGNSKRIQNHGASIANTGNLTIDIADVDIDNIHGIAEATEEIHKYVMGDDSMDLQSEPIVYQWKKMNVTKQMLEDIEYQSFQLSDMPDVLDNTAELVIQYGYIMLFVSIFPLMPLLALVNNYIESRVDYYNLIYSRRCIPFGAYGIGVWKLIIRIGYVVAVFTNMSLLTFRTQIVKERFDTSDHLHQWLFFIVVTFIMVTLMYAVKMFIPERSYSMKVQARRQRVEYWQTYMILFYMSLIYPFD